MAKYILILNNKISFAQFSQYHPNTPSQQKSKQVHENDPVLIQNKAENSRFLHT